jgi:hypothetical protein
MNKFTFITGMPRTRQAWLSAFLDGASEKVRTSFDAGFHDYITNDDSLVKVSCGSGNLSKFNEINELRLNADNQVTVIWIERDERESFIALRRHLESFGIRMNYHESSKIFEGIKESKKNFLGSVAVDHVFKFEEIDDKILDISRLACGYSPTTDRIKLFQRLRISEIISPEQRSDLLQLIRGLSLPSNQTGQRFFYDHTFTDEYWSPSEGHYNSGATNSRHSPCSYSTN